MTDSPALPPVTDPVEATLDTARHAAFRQVIRMFSGRWKLEILCLLRHRPHRFAELRRTIPNITPQMLSVQLRELEADGLITRRAYDDRPVKVEYAITEVVDRFAPIFDTVVDWGAANVIHVGEDRKAA